VTGFCEHGNKLLGNKKFLKKDSALRSYLISNNRQTEDILQQRNVYSIYEKCM